MKVFSIMEYILSPTLAHESYLFVFWHKLLGRQLERRPLFFYRVCESFAHVLVSTEAEL